MPASLDSPVRINERTSSTRLIASLVYCLLALAGCHERNVTTSITRATRDVIFSRTLTTATTTNVHCLASDSGHCCYLIYEEQCATRRAGDTAGAPVCARKALDSFALTPGQVREFHGVSGQAHTCVDTAAPRADCHGEAASSEARGWAAVHWICRGRTRKTPVSLNRH
ncbi:hypothetical protein ADT25_06135 [Xanthomonas oryzae]|uniref:Uncharacterized protein n=1 Tax=Xanthomonas oryzae TaxID=347 RepID=A0AAP1EZN2_9XANT|nr:hypothetical protein ADT25_06135 [Xanthomonas oryzae]QBG85186.1 hypothetical protein EYR27_16765 [Xanthomonas oryzae]